VKFCFWLAVVVTTHAWLIAPSPTSDGWSWKSFVIKSIACIASVYVFNAAWDTARKDGKREAMEAGGGK